MSLPPPPIPSKLRDALKDYPEHIEELQKTLDSVKGRRIRSFPAFHYAAWKLEDCLADFIAEARAQVATAGASGDPRAIERAKEKEKLMIYARSICTGLANLSELRAYFAANKG
ncbi:hypothetical protein [Stenotrophomonas sp.]|uniref:hypothetical protein n=1 Tax=Stenotrophomonas sp. TaxID=69392 RepID=UPI002D441208|nr:hypothetical protein [Stenotrophomonas sp.]HYQ23523.1 hypothetical protein [Stenotrophomonas sp.]